MRVLENLFSAQGSSSAAPWCITSSWCRNWPSRTCQGHGEKVQTCSVHLIDFPVSAPMSCYSHYFSFIACFKSRWDESSFIALFPPNYQGHSCTSSLQNRKISLSCSSLFLKKIVPETLLLANFIHIFWGLERF